MKVCGLSLLIRTMKNPKLEAHRHEELRVSGFASSVGLASALIDSLLELRQDGLAELGGDGGDRRLLGVAVEEVVDSLSRQRAELAQVGDRGLGALEVGAVHVQA